MSSASDYHGGRYHPGTRVTGKGDLLHQNDLPVEMVAAIAVQVAVYG